MCQSVTPLSFIDTHERSVYCVATINRSAMTIRGRRMRSISRGILLLVALLLLLRPVPAAAQALGTIAGVAKDASGAVLPGVTVEASSPALIEKVRTVVTDGSGQYQVVSLPPGS